MSLIKFPDAAEKLRRERVVDLARIRALNSVASYRSRDEEVVRARDEVDHALTQAILMEAGELPETDSVREVADFIQHLDQKHGRPEHLARFLRDHEKNK